MKRVTFDFETRGYLELKKSGAYKYSLHHLTQPTCLAIKVRGKKPVQFLDFETINTPWAELDDVFRDWWQGLIDEECEFSAHNAFFERCIYDNIMVERYGWPSIPPRQYRCTAAKAAACALPRALEKAGEAMRLPVQKDKRGYAAMMATCKPTKAYRAWEKMNAAIGERNDAGKNLTPKQMKWVGERKDIHPPPMFLAPDDAPEVWATLYRYCIMDVEAEECLDDALPDLIPAEQEIWFLNQKLNWRGLRIDVPTVKKISGIMAAENKKKLKELDKLTLGLVTKPGARKSIFEFLEMEGVKLPNLQAKTVDEMLKGFDLSPDMRTLLEIRKALSLASTKKYQSFLDRAADDGRVRDILMYHGSSTGRDTGTGIQPHNFPRGVLKFERGRPYAHVENVVELEQHGLELIYGESLGMLFSSILRNMLIPSDGCELFVADFSKIEVAVLWWAADNEPGLKVLRAGKDPYIYQGASNFNISYEEFIRVHGEDGNARQLPKAQTLGCGFGMGADRFRVAAASPPYFLKLTAEQSKLAVDNYRLANPRVPALWREVEKAAVAATEKPNHTFEAGKCKFRREKGFLWIKLPSGRKLAYKDPQISWRQTDFGPRKTLEFWGVNPKTRKWDIERTWGGSLVENIVQAIARDLMMPAMLRLEEKGYRALLMVHDEGICERKIGRGSLDEFVATLCQVPSWGSGLPIDAKGWVGPRYRK